MAALPLLNLWSKRSMLVYFSVMTTRIRYQGTYFGFLWNVLEPLGGFIILYIVFTTIRIGIEPNFPVYLLFGITLFQIFIRGTLNGLISIKNNAAIIKSLNLRKEFFPVSSVASTGLIMIVQVAVFFSLMPVFNYTPPWTSFLLVIPLFLLLVLILGLSYFLSTVFIYIKDIQPTWSIFTYALFFVSPIIWYVDKVEGILLEIHKINPLGQLIEIGHKLLFNELPTPIEWITVCGYVFAILFIGFFILQKYEKRLAEEL